MGQFKLIAAGAAFLALSAFSAYAQDGRQEAAPELKEKPFVAAIGADGVQHVEITGGEYYFEPEHIVVKVDVPVELRVKKTPGFVPHDIVVKAPDAGIDFKIDLEKEPRPVRFTPTKVGTYEMFCGEKLLFFKSHREKGMKGVIEVVP